jgi:hypothetical protein
VVCVLRAVPEAAEADVNEPAIIVVPDVEKPPETIWTGTWLVTVTPTNPQSPVTLTPNVRSVMVLPDTVNDTVDPSEVVPLHAPAVGVTVPPLGLVGPSSLQPATPANAVTIRNAVNERPNPGSSKQRVDTWSGKC